MRIRHYLVAAFMLAAFAVPSLTFAADCSAIEAQITDLRAQASHATGLQLQILNLQITLAQLQLSQCNAPTPPTDNGPKGKLVAYLNGEFYFSSEGISRTEALYNCKLNGGTIPVAVFSYYCTWNGEEIYRTGEGASYPVKIKVLSPNGGESYVAGSNKPLTVMWQATQVPKDSVVCVGLYSDNPGQTSQYAFNFPGDGGCKTAKKGINKVTGTLIRNSGYDLAPGLYKAQVRITEKAQANGKDGAILGEDMSDAPFTLTGATGPTSAFLSYALLNKAVDPGESWVEGANLEGFLLQIKNTLPTAQSITFPTNCWWTYRIYDVATGKVAFDLKDVQECLKPTSATPTTFTLKSGETKSLDFSHNDSTFHLVPGNYRMNIDVNSTRPAANAASFVFGITARANSATATIDASSLNQVASTSFKLTGSAANIVNTYGNMLSIAYRPIGSNGPSGGGYASVSNGRWTWPAGTGLSLSAGSYAVQVSDPGSTRVLASSTLSVVASSAKPACVLSLISPGHIGSDLTKIAIGSWVNIRWTSVNASYAILPGGDKGPANGEETYYPEVTKTYSYKFVGPGGEVTCSKTITVVGGEDPNPPTLPNSSLLSATPQSGVAPLRVTFTGTMNAKKSCGGGSQVLAFGDGETYQMAFPSDVCRAQPWSVTHTFAESGSHIARLYAGYVVAGKEELARTSVNVAPALAPFAPSTGTGATVTKPTQTPDTSNPNTGGTNTGGNTQTDTKTLPETLGCTDGYKTIKGTKCQLEASAYSALLAAVAAIQAQLNELAR